MPIGFIRSCDSHWGISFNNRRAGSFPRGHLITSVGWGTIWKMPLNIPVYLPIEREYVVLWKKYFFSIKIWIGEGKIWRAPELFYTHITTPPHTHSLRVGFTLASWNIIAVTLCKYIYFSTAVEKFFHAYDLHDKWTSKVCQPNVETITWVICGSIEIHVFDILAL